MLEITEKKLVPRRQINDVSLIYSLTGVPTTPVKLWSQLEQFFIENVPQAAKPGQKIPPDVVSIYAYGFSCARQGGEQFWNTVWENAEVTSLNGAINLANALFDLPF